MFSVNIESGDWMIGGRKEYFDGGTIKEKIEASKDDFNKKIKRRGLNGKTARTLYPPRAYTEAV